MLFPACGWQASESWPKPCSTMLSGRLSSSISSFYKYFAPLEQAPIKRFGWLVQISARGVRLKASRLHQRC